LGLGGGYEPRMYSVYVLISLKNGKKYTGFTSKEVVQRLKEHNKGCNIWARHNRPFELIHSEKYNTEQEARKRERFLKSGSGRRDLDKILCACNSVRIEYFPPTPDFTLCMADPP
jgi:putative endonuclease